MTYTKEQAKQKIKERVERFMYNLDVYKKSTYNETQVRQEFINPFFEALGWDVSNKEGYAEQYKEVVHEDAIKVGRSTRAPDYSFRIGGQRKFFVEAKKPAVNIKEDVSPAYQLRRYAWSAKLPLSVVTDFEEFSVFDCRIKPNPNDKSSVGRIAYYTFDEYLDSDTFDKIYDVFSREAVLKGGFDKYAESTKGKKGTAEVDSEFLKEIESWRELLAKNIALRNPDVSIYELNYAVQKIIDRIIFLRICEDRGIEPYGQLQTKAESGDVYTHLLNHFKLAESKYDSGIFDFNTDRITSTLSIDDRVLKTIIQSLYYPKSPYEFSVLGVEILGNVYEQFLGKVIRLTAGHQAKVETKPEVKKAGGVYYTPQYIVDYIVKNTVGKLVEGKTPEEIAAIKILDPACGSGSFLIGAYTYLLQYHLDWYTNNNPKKHKDAVFQVRENEWYLTTAEKKRILLNNIFGVDIDPQAVEVTRLSLLLKVLENESCESIDQQVKLGLEGVLPNLEGNVKCGNSLIGPDFYDSGQVTLFGDEEMRRINVFDWNDDVKGFGKIMKRGGFDCVIGNPPYHSVKLMEQKSKDYFYECYKVGVKRFNLFSIFIEKSISLLNRSGKFGFIIPSSFLANSQYIELRKLILNNFAINEIVNFEGGVFSGANVETLIIIMSRSLNNETRQQNKILLTHSITDFINKKFIQDWKQQVEFEASSSKIFMLGASKLIGPENTTPLKDVATIRNGINTGNIANRILTDKYENEDCKPIIDGKDVQRYEEPRWREKYLIYSVDYVESLREELRKKGKLWTARIIKKENYFEREKIIIQRIRNLSLRRRLVLTYDSKGYYTSINIGVIFAKAGSKYNLWYLLGILNSTLMNEYYSRRFHNIQIKNKFLEQLPIRTINFGDPEDVTQHDKLVSLVENMLELQKKYHEARMEIDKGLYEQRIKVVDTQIDRLVYDLYGLTEEEVRVVEGGVK